MAEDAAEDLPDDEVEDLPDDAAEDLANDKAENLPNDAVEDLPKDAAKDPSKCEMPRLTLFPWLQFFLPTPTFASQTMTDLHCIQCDPFMCSCTSLTFMIFILT